MIHEKIVDVLNQNRSEVCSREIASGSFNMVRCIQA